MKYSIPVMGWRPVLDLVPQSRVELRAGVAPVRQRPSVVPASKDLELSENTSQLYSFILTLILKDK